jgi:hypothetical protein
MSQNAETGRKGYINGYERADEIGALLGAARISKRNNDFMWQDQIIVIKTGPSVVVTRSTLARVMFVVYGERKDAEWKLYQIDPTTFEKLSVQSRSRNHNENYRSVHSTKIREHGSQIPIST